MNMIKTKNNELDTLMKMQRETLLMSQQVLGKVGEIDKVVQDHTDKFRVWEERWDRHMVINSGQAKTLRKIANKRVRELLPQEEDYKRLRSQYYSWLWNSYQEAFGVTSYLDTRLRHFEAACDWIKEWRPIQSATKIAK